MKILLSLFLALLLFHKTEAAGDYEAEGEVSRGGGGAEDLNNKAEQVEINVTPLALMLFINVFQLEFHFNNCWKFLKFLRDRRLHRDDSGETQPHSGTFLC